MDQSTIIVSGIYNAFKPNQWDISTDLVDTNARQWSRLQRMGDKALDVLEETLACDDPRLRVAVAMKIAIMRYIHPDQQAQKEAMHRYATAMRERKLKRVK